MSHASEHSLLLSPEEYLRRADHLPPAPTVLPQLLSLLADPNCDAREVIELISFDAGITTKVLRICNSAAFGLPRPVTDVDEAVQRLGMRMIYQMVAAAAGARALQTTGTPFPQAAQFWEHSVTTALAAQMLAQDLRLEDGALFTAGLLHDIGKVLFVEVWRERYTKAWDAAAATSESLLTFEREQFGLNHGELGGRLLAFWKFPSLISASVWHHPAPAARIPFERETACLTLAEAIAEQCRLPVGSVAPPLTTGQQTALQILELDDPRLRACVARTQENFEFVNAMCRLRG